MRFKRRLAKLFYDWQFRTSPVCQELNARGRLVEKIDDMLISDPIAVDMFPKKGATFTLEATLKNHYVTRTTPYGTMIWQLRHDRDDYAFYNDTYNRIMADWDVAKTECSDIFKELRSITNPYVEAHAKALGVVSVY